MARRDKVDFDQFTEDYNQLLSEGTKFFTKNDSYFAEYQVEILNREVVDKPRRILEYGCGIGRNIPFLISKFPDAVIHGSDISPASIEYARASNPGIQFFVEGLGQDQDILKYDLIFVAGVFHHVPVRERTGVMKTLKDRLTEDGQLFIFEHNPFNPVTRKIVSDCPYDADAILLKPIEMKRLLSQVGLNLCKTSYCLFIPPGLSIFKPIEFRLGWLPLGGKYWVHANRVV